MATVLSIVLTDDKEYVFPAGIPVVDETHGGEDVAIYAIGPMAHMFQAACTSRTISHT